MSLSFDFPAGSLQDYAVMVRGLTPAPPPLFPEKLKIFFVFSETRPYKGHFWKKKYFFPLGGQKHLEKFKNWGYPPKKIHQKKCVLNDSEWPKTDFKQVFKKLKF